MFQRCMSANMVQIFCLRAAFSPFLSRKSPQDLLKRYHILHYFLLIVKSTASPAMWLRHKFLRPKHMYPTEHNNTFKKRTSFKSSSNNSIVQDSQAGRTYISAFSEFPQVGSVWRLILHTPTNYLLLYALSKQIEIGSYQSRCIIWVHQKTELVLPTPFSQSASLCSSLWIEMQSDKKSGWLTLFSLSQHKCEIWGCQLVNLQVLVKDNVAGGFVLLFTSMEKGRHGLEATT